MARSDDSSLLRSCAVGSLFAPMMSVLASSPSVDDPFCLWLEVACTPNTRRSRSGSLSETSRAVFSPSDPNTCFLRVRPLRQSASSRAVASQRHLRPRTTRKLLSRRPICHEKGRTMKPELVSAPDPFGLTCGYLRQERRWIKFDQPDAPGKPVLGAFCCTHPNREHASALQRSAVEACKRRGTSCCPIPVPEPGKRPPPE